jgi:hypothetical protein
MNRIGNGEGHRPLAGTVGPAVTKPGDETHPLRGARAAAAGPPSPVGVAR